jgi:hypothetical protein
MLFPPGCTVHSTLKCTTPTDDFQRPLGANPDLPYQRLALARVQLALQLGDPRIGDRDAPGTPARADLLKPTPEHAERILRCSARPWRPPTASPNTPPALLYQAHCGPAVSPVRWREVATSRPGNPPFSSPPSPGFDPQCRFSFSYALRIWQQRLSGTALLAETGCIHSPYTLDWTHESVPFPFPR